MDDFDLSELEACQRSTFNIAVHDTSYKNGAFKNQITASTDVLDSIKIFIDSPLTTEWEKDKFRAAGQAIFDVRHHHTGDTEQGRWTVLLEFYELTTVFEKDMFERGLNAPSLIAQTIDRKGNVKETTTCDTYGNVTAIPGGPDLLGAMNAHAAAEDKKESAKTNTAETGTEKMRTTAGKLTIYSYIISNNLTDTSSDPNTKATTSSSASPNETKKKKNGADAKDGQFDETFKGNLRGAFD